MSQTNHYRQVSKKEAKKHNAKLNSLLKEFFAFLDRLHTEPPGHPDIFVV